MNIDNQKDYWDSVAQQKTFTHPVDTDLLLNYADKDAAIIDYGCGYGRVVSDLLKLGFTNIAGYDTSVELINPGANSHLLLHHIITPADLPLNDGSVDCFLLFAVLTFHPLQCGANEFN